MPVAGRTVSSVTPCGRGDKGVGERKRGFERESLLRQRETAAGKVEISTASLPVLTIVLLKFLRQDV
jgi:hypothetical protein